MKKYKYKDRIYCEEDLSEEIDNYAGDLFDLYWELRQDRICKEHTVYYPAEAESSSQYYDSPEELIENEFSDLETDD